MPTSSDNRGVQHNCASNFIGPTGKSPRIDSISPAHDFTNGSCCPLLESAVKTSLQKVSYLFLTFPFNHGFQHFILLLFSERKNGKEVRNSALKTDAVLFKAREPPT